MTERIEVMLDLTNRKYLGEMYQRIKEAQGFPAAQPQEFPVFLHPDSPVFLHPDCPEDKEW